MVGITPLDQTPLKAVPSEQVVNKTQTMLIDQDSPVAPGSLATDWETTDLEFPAQAGEVSEEVQEIALSPVEEILVIPTHVERTLNVPLGEKELFAAVGLIILVIHTQDANLILVPEAPVELMLNVLTEMEGLSAGVCLDMKVTHTLAVMMIPVTETLHPVIEMLIVPAVEGKPFASAGKDMKVMVMEPAD